MTVFQEMVVESILQNQIKWSWYRSSQKTMFYLINEIKICYHFEYQSNKDREFRFWGPHSIRMVITIESLLEVWMCLSLTSGYIWLKAFGIVDRLFPWGVGIQVRPHVLDFQLELLLCSICCPLEWAYTVDFINCLGHEYALESCMVHTSDFLRGSNFSNMYFAFGWIINSNT